ncbi:MAG: HlyD family efflux transporter periplasmic adaptor subunit [Deltaproteobacteria bacterium]|nr:HlyD family efflux transporter periplasmic adaptor subunit [Deltaproteobacteria bacterium]
MGWRTRDAVTRHGPHALLACSIVFVVALALGRPSGTVPGYAEVSPVRIGSLESGRVVGVDVEPGQLLEQDAVVGTLDEGPIRGRIRVLEAELSRSGALLEGQKRDAQTSLALAQAGRAESRARLRAARESLALAESRLESARKQVTAGLATRDILTRPEAEVATLKGEVAQWSARLSAQSQVADIAESGMEQGDDDAAPAVASGARALGVVQEELALLELRRLDMTLRSPLAGRVSAVHYRKGEVLRAQEVFAELLPLETTTVVACVPENFGQRVEAGGEVELWPADGGSPREGTVVDVSGLVSEAPDRCKQRPNEVGWVRPVRIAVDGAGLVPGQRFDVAFEGATDDD